MVKYFLFLLLGIALLATYQNSNEEQLQENIIQKQ